MSGMRKETNDVRGKLRDQRSKKGCEKRVQEDGADSGKVGTVATRD
jgi:hypothetical protein